MSNRRERRQILRKMGLLKETKSNKDLLGDSIERGNNKHRQHLQRVKNDMLMKERERSGLQDENNVFFYRNQESEYSSLKSLLLNRNWDDLESDDSDAE